MGIHKRYQAAAATEQNLKKIGEKGQVGSFTPS
jgi:hypothetical protein